jgi:hypothetical protein
MSEQSPHEQHAHQSRKKSYRSPLLDLPLDDEPRYHKRARIFQGQRYIDLRGTRARNDKLPPWLSPIVAGVLDYLVWFTRDLPLFLQRVANREPAVHQHRPAPPRHKPTHREEHPPQRNAAAAQQPETVVLHPAETIDTSAEEAEHNTLASRSAQTGSTAQTDAQGKAPLTTRTDKPHHNERPLFTLPEHEHQQQKPRPAATPRQASTPTARRAAHSYRPTTHTNAKRDRTNDSLSTATMAYLEQKFATLEEAEWLNIDKLVPQARRLNAAMFTDGANLPVPGGAQVSNFLHQYKTGIISLVATVIIIVCFLALANPTYLSEWGGPFNRFSETVQQVFGSSTLPQRPVGDYHLEAAPSLNAGQIDAILADYGSPAAGTGRDWMELGEKYGIDPAFGVAFFIHESSAATNPGWAGIKPDGTTTHNVGNIICAGYPTCYGRFRDYDSWQVGIEDWYRLIRHEYIESRNLQTVRQIIPIYAPSIENDVEQFIISVEQMVDSWRQGNIP